MFDACAKLSFNLCIFIPFETLRKKKRGEVFSLSKEIRAFRRIVINWRLCKFLMLKAYVGKIKKSKGAKHLHCSASIYVLSLRLELNCFENCFSRFLVLKIILELFCFQNNFACLWNILVLKILFNAFKAF